MEQRLFERRRDLFSELSPVFMDTTRASDAFRVAVPKMGQTCSRSKRVACLQRAIVTHYGLR